MIIVDNAAKICKIDVIPSGIADHEMIGLVCKLNCVKFPAREISCCDYRYYDPQKLNSHLNAQDWERIFQRTNVNNAWSLMNDILSDALNKFEAKNKQVHPSKNENCHLETSFDIDGKKVSNPHNVVQGLCKYFSSAVDN